MKITVEQIVVNNFINSSDCKDILHTDRICEILNENGDKTNVVEAGRLINRIGICRYDSKHR